MAVIPNLLFLCCVLVLSGSLIVTNMACTVFIFGDSTADVGTNNHLSSKLARANFPHNGIDFPHSRHTGRFSNGFNGADELAQKFGLKSSPPPYLLMLKSGVGKRLIRGANFASGGAGIPDATGFNLTVVPLSEQISQFSTVRENITAMIGSNATKELLSESLFFISVGSNDIFAYFNQTNRPDPGQYIYTLMSEFANHTTNLYSLGARRFGIIGVSLVGCCPSQRLIQMQLNGTNGCLPPMNDLAEAFHLALDGLLQNISTELPEMKYSLGNTFNMTSDLLKFPQIYNFTNLDSACCGYGTLGAEGPCNKTASLCPDRTKYLFWDRFHPTQKASELVADVLYNGPSTYVTPITFAQLLD